MSDIQLVTTGLDKELSKKLEAVKYSPMDMARLILNNIEVNSGKKIDIVDPTNPWIALMDAVVVTGANSAIEPLVILRELYPQLADTESNLYRHMSDVDYLNRFALPATATIRVVVLLADFERYAIPDDPTNPSYKQITIPRNSFINADGLYFTLQYPINIRKYTNGNLQVLYDDDIPSPLQNLYTGLIKSNVFTDEGKNDWIMFDIEVQQTKAVSSEFGVTLSAPFMETIAFEDDFHYALVYNKSNVTNNEWVRIPTTFSDTVHDPLTPTATLSVEGQSLKVRIPNIYTSVGSITPNSLISGSIRVDVYSTKGKIYQSLKEIPPDKWTITYRAIDNVRDTNVYTAATPNVNIAALSNDFLEGGRDALTLDDLRSEIINNTVGPNDLPITEYQLATEASRLGYDLIKQVDLVTERIYSVSKAMPQSSIPKIEAIVDMTVNTLVATRSKLSTMPGVVDFNDRVVIKSNTLFKLQDDILDFVLASELADLDYTNKTPSEIATLVNANEYYYIPFHYVIDMVGNQTSVRVYNLDVPKVDLLTFVDDNPHVDPSVNTGSYVFERTSTGYRLVLTTISSDGYKSLPDFEVGVQIKLPIVDTNSYVFINGTLLGVNSDGERMYEFIINTSLDITDQDRIALSGFSGITNEVYSPLISAIDILYWTTNITVPLIQYDINGELDTSNIPNSANAKVFSKESMTLVFGDRLQYIWNKVRTNYTEDKYLRYTTDQPDYYEEDIYDRDPVTGSIFEVGDDCTIDYNIRHHKGDPILDADGNPKYKYRAGDVVYDSDGNPVIDEQSGIALYVDLVMIEGDYLIANSDDQKDYQTEIRDILTRRLKTDLAKLNENKLEFTSMLYKPLKTSGSIKVRSGRDIEHVINSKQSPKVTIYITEDVENNIELLKGMEEKVRSILKAAFEKPVVTITTLRTDILQGIGNNAVGVKIAGIDLIDDIERYSVVNEDTRMSLDKILLVNDDRTTSVHYNVDFEFITI